MHPSTLFHFTETEGAFFNILSDKCFKPSLAREIIESIGSRRRFGVPMVSFCDIRLSQLDDHTQKYGEFGFGMTKEWAERKYLHPVFYMSKGSSLFSKYNKRMRVLKDKLMPLWEKRDCLDERVKKEFRILKDEYSDLYNLLRYMKNYKGKLIRDGIVQSENFIFADEKEWRYVPEPFVGDMWPSLNWERILTKKEKNEFSMKFSQFNITFDLDDVKYIIIPNDAYLSRTIEALSDDKKYHPDQLRKVLTIKQMKDDF